MRRGRVLVRDDQHLRGTRGHVDGHHSLRVLERHLRRRHELVPRAEDLVNLGAGLRPVAHRRHGLGTASLENVRHPRLLGHVQHLGYHGPVLLRRRGENHVFTPGDHGGDGEHERGGREHGGPPGHVQAHGADGPAHPSAPHARHGLHVHVRDVLLRLVELFDVCERHVEGFSDVIVEDRVGEVGDLHDDGVEVHAVELGRVLPDGGVTPGGDRVHDGRDGAEDGGEVHPRALEDLDALLGVEVVVDVGADGHLIGLSDGGADVEVAAVRSTRDWGATGTGGRRGSRAGESGNDPGDCGRRNHRADGVGWRRTRGPGLRGVSFAATGRGARAGLRLAGSAGYVLDDVASDGVNVTLVGLWRDEGPRQDHELTWSHSRSPRSRRS